MTVRARLIRVSADACMRPLRLVMTAHACTRFDRLVGSEAVAVPALELRGPMDRICVQRSRHRAVARVAQIFRRHGVRGVVAARAGNLVLGDMRDVAGAVANRHPRGGDVARDDEGFVAAGSDDERHDDKRAGHRAPSGWQSRHGMALIGWRLDHPGGCGLPPMPPTAWHVTHSDSPAPP